MRQRETERERDREGGRQRGRETERDRKTERESIDLLPPVVDDRIVGREIIACRKSHWRSARLHIPASSGESVTSDPGILKSSLFNLKPIF